MTSVVSEKIYFSENHYQGLFWTCLKKIGAFVFVCFFCAVAQAQSAKQFSAKGQEAEEQADYYAAAQIYKQAAELFPDNTEFRYRYAENCRLYNDYANAATAYKEVVTDDKEKNYPLALFWQAAMTRQSGKYTEAQKLLEQFKKQFQGEKEYIEKANREIAFCQWAQKQNKKTAIQILHLDKPINSVYSDFNPFTDKKNELLYSSMRNKKEHFLSRFYTADSSSKEPLPWNSSNPEKHIANGFFNSAFDEFYFTLCDDNAEKYCAIYLSTLNSNWSNAQKIESINSKNSSNTQPCLAKINGSEYLLFASNRSGGKGGFDLYKTKRINKTTFAKPENLQTLNTKDNEYTPFFDADSGKLFFASDGWNNFGGLDIFSVSVDSIHENTMPRNAGYGINSEANDFGYTLSTDLSKAYFSSNRKGSFFIKAETCCNDLWYYETGRIKRDSVKVKTPVIEAKFTDTIVTRIPPQETELTALMKDLPITLYFHNDEPECCNMRDSTALNYVTTYQEYRKLLIDYKLHFAQGDSTEKTGEEEAIFGLFTNKVERGMRQLVEFSSALLETLMKGKKVTLTIKGYCSPLNYNQYNIHLGYRRVASVKNYFYQYRSGKLREFIDAGLLVLKKESFGEETAPTDISDKREDTRNSVYNPSAALERRVEIISVTVE